MCTVFLCFLLGIMMLPLTASAGDPEHPEFVDPLRDVKLFGLIPIPLQMEFKYADIVAAWMYEESINSGDLCISLQIRDLEERTESLEAIYVVDWVWNNDRFVVFLHINPTGVGSFVVERSLDDNDDMDDWMICDGTVDVETNIITWVVPKTFIGNPPKGSSMKDIFPMTDLRFTDDSGLPIIDLFKDYPYNAKLTHNYILRY